MIKEILRVEYPVLALIALFIVMRMIMILINTKEVKSGYRLFITYYFALYFFIGFVFAFIFFLMKEDFTPNVEWFDAIYFSFITLSTTGFGDIHPNLNAHFTQSVIIVENAVGHFLTVFIAAYIISKRMND